MKITELLKLLDKEYNEDFTIRIFSDGSGSIEDGDGSDTCVFENEEEMQELLNGIYVELQEKNKIKFEL